MPWRHVAHTDGAAEVKAVTWHGLRVERADAGWRAHVLLDL